MVSSERFSSMRTTTCSMPGRMEAGDSAMARSLWNHATMANNYQELNPPLRGYQTTGTGPACVAKSPSPRAPAVFPPQQFGREREVHRLGGACHVGGHREVGHATVGRSHHDQGRAGECGDEQRGGAARSRAVLGHGSGRRAPELPVIIAAPAEHGAVV